MEWKSTHLIFVYGKRMELYGHADILEQLLHRSVTPLENKGMRNGMNQDDDDGDDDEHVICTSQL